MRSARLWGLALAALLAAGAAAVSAQDPAEPVDPDLASVEVTLWRSVADPSVLYLSTRPQGGSWRTEQAPLDMSRLSRSGRFHQSNAITVTVTLTNGDRVNVEVTVWRSVADPSVLYLSTRPQGGSWRTEQAPLDMSRLSRSGRFHQSNAITVDVPLPEPNEPAAPGGDRGSVDSGDDHTCTMQSTAARVIASTVRVETSTNTVGTAFYAGNGQFITAAHVIDDNPATIRLHNTSYDAYASVIGYTNDDDGDIAILSAPSSGLTALEWAGTLSVGETIAVVGYPEGLGLSASITRGIVSRLFTAEGVSYIQTDSAVSPGNSGGPLVDACGRVAGVMSASYVGERGSEGLHFAVGEPTLAARLTALRSGQYVRPVEDVPESYLTITAFCTELPSEDLQSAECARRSSSFILDGGRTWSLWARGVDDWDDVVYRFNGGARQYESGVKAALQALGAGCHELQIAEEDVSTHWSAAYQFCIVQSTVRSLAQAERAPLWIRISNDYLGYLSVEFSQYAGTVPSFRAQIKIHYGTYIREFFNGEIVFSDAWSDSLCCSYVWEWTMHHTLISHVSARLRIDGVLQSYRCERNVVYSERTFSMWACE